MDIVGILVAWILMIIICLCCGCASPTYIRKCNAMAAQCNSLAKNCTLLLDICMEDKEEADFKDVRLQTCEAENSRLTKIILGEEPVKK